MANSKYEYVKSFEVNDELMLPNLLVVKIGGRDFRRFSELHEFDKPNDAKALNLMNSCAAVVLEEYPDIAFSYGFSDEYSFVFKKTTKFYQRRASKIVSVIVSFFTSVYAIKWIEFFPLKELRYPPSFHARYICCPTIEVLQEYLAWRQETCHINNMYNTCLWMLVKCGNTEREAQEHLKVVTDSASAYVKAGEELMKKRKHLFWSPCAAHCIDNMLKDIGELNLHKETMSKARTITVYIYNHTWVLNLMREYIGGNLTRAGVTRFATEYLTLKSLAESKIELNAMFSSEEWQRSSFAKKKDGMRVRDIIVADAEFWPSVKYCLNCVVPLVKVLRLVDGDVKPAMGYIYEAMDKAKEQIAKNFNGVKKRYKVIWDIIDSRWDLQLHRPLHAAAYYLNPRFQYAPEFDADYEIMKGLYETIERMCPSPALREKVDKQRDLFRNAELMFGREMAIQMRDKKHPALWWESYGSCCKELQKLAIRILSLTCSATGCERNWSTFDQDISKDGKNELLFTEFGINYKKLPDMFRQGSCVFRTKVESIVKYRQSGTPIKRFKRKVIIVHSKKIAGGTFWNEHSSLVEELGHFGEVISKNKPEYVRSFQFGNKLMPSTWIIIRIDGCHFHRFSEVHEFEKPNDVHALNLMNSCAMAVLEEFQDIILAYGVSDEYSFVLKKDSQFYQRRASETMTVIVSFFSSIYVTKWKEFFPKKELKYPPSFDGRAVCYPSYESLRDYMAWRQVDCHINNQFNTCFWKLVKSGKSRSEAQAEIKEKQSEEKGEKRVSLPHKFDIDYDKLPIMFRIGSLVFREKEEKPSGTKPVLGKKSTISGDLEKCWTC